MTDRNEALRLADELAEEAGRRVCHVAMAPASLLKDAAALLRQLSAERDQLRAEVERLRVDAERLDWLEKCPATQLPKDSEAMRRWLWHRPAGAGNIRAAIDHARTTHKDER